jgi:hypothetical protein
MLLYTLLYLYLPWYVLPTLKLYGLFSFLFQIFTIYRKPTQFCGIFYFKVQYIKLPMKLVMEMKHFQQFSIDGSVMLLYVEKCQNGLHFILYIKTLFGAYLIL